MVSNYERQYIPNREELYQYLEDQMCRSYKQLLDKGQVETGSFYVKSFLLECDWKPHLWGQEQEKKYLRNLLSVHPEGKQRLSSDATIFETDETGFYIVNWQWKKQPKPTTLYLDTISDSTRRFWRAYSISHANHLDDIMNRLIDSQTYLDRVWLWSNLLQTTQNKGEPKGFKFEHDRSFPEQQNDDSKTSEPFSLKFSGNQTEAQRLLKVIENDDYLKKQTSLANIRMKYFRPSAREEFSIETLYFNGKFTTHGTSFLAHKKLVEELQKTYAEKVSHIEDNYIIHATGNESSWYISGDPIIFDLSNSPIEDVDVFCRVVFSGKLPFKLWGTPRPTISEEGRTVAAVDLHNGAKLFFEVYPDIICMYLSVGSCGNTAIRFYTNLQRSFSRLVVVQDNDENELF